MIKGLIKFLLTVVLILITAIIYLSTVGIKTDKFNDQIKKGILEINNKINKETINIECVTHPLFWFWGWE